MIKNTPPKVGFISLGCPKALVDSEHIITQLRTEGYEISATYKDANLVVVNTCGFIDSAIEESLETIGEALAENGKVIVTGCLGAQGSLVQDKFPQVLAISGPHAKQEVMIAVRHHLPPLDNSDHARVPAQGVKLTPSHYAYLKISEGCNHRCTFCIIPSLRGNLNSRPVGEVMREAENLVNAGVKELLVISQDTSAYGVDKKFRTDFWDGRPIKTQFKALVAALGELDVWTRLHYVYPYPHIDEVLSLMTLGKVLPYLDVPFQHASPSVLKAMKRPAHSENTLQRIRSWREQCSDLVLRSTFIVGFPGETADDFKRLLDFLREAELDRVGCFAYSPVDGAVANALPNPINEEVKEERLAIFMETQAEISATKLQRRIGQKMTVLVDEVGGDALVARSYADAPEVDGIVVVEEAGLNVNPGDFIEVEIVNSDTHDLYAKQLDHRGV